MKIKLNPSNLRKLMAGFSMMEMTIGMGIAGTTIGAVMSGFTSGMFTMQMGRENLRATQIMLEKMETIRLYSWDQISTPNFVPTAFTNYFDPISSNSGTVYTGTMTIAPAPVTSTYSNDMKVITVTVNWTTGNLPRSRQFTSYISHYGMQDYIY
jgi:hypothetical protein